MASGHSQPDFPVRMRDKSRSPFRDFSHGARPMSQQEPEDNFFGGPNGRDRANTMTPKSGTPNLFLRSKSQRMYRTRKASDSVIHLDRPSSGPLEQIQLPDEAEVLSEVVFRQWKFEEVVDILQTGLITLPGGHDRQGGAIIVVSLNEKMDLTPVLLGKTLMYLSSVPDDAVRSLKFTVIVDARNGSLKGLQDTLKTMQNTFSHQIGQTLVLKPKGITQKFKSNSTIYGKKSKITYPVHVLDNSSDLWQHIGINQVPSSLGGNLTYDHREWLEACKVLDSLYSEVNRMLDELGQLQLKMDSYIPAPNVHSARCMLQEHMTMNRVINPDKMTHLARRKQGDLKRLRMPAMHPAAFTATKHPDFVVRMETVDALFAELIDRFSLVERAWNEKNDLLNQWLQLRNFEEESDEFIRWICTDGHSYLLSQTAVGLSTSQAQAALRDHEACRLKMMEHDSTYARVYQMGCRLVEMNSYGCKDAGMRVDKLKAQWEDFTRQLQRWGYLFQASVEFHKMAQEFLDGLKRWYEKCRPFINPPDSVSIVERLLREHGDVRQQYKQIFEKICYHGNKMTEMMKEPVLLTSEGKQPPFLASMRHVRESQQQTVQDEELLSQQWQKHADYLQQLLTLKQFAVDSGRVKRWATAQGCDFLTASVGIGSTATEADQLLASHDQFEASSSEMFSKYNSLIGQSKELSESGRVDVDLMEDEIASLEISFGAFVAHLDERREIILMAKGLFVKVEQVRSLCGHILEAFLGGGAVPHTQEECEVMNAEFEATKNGLFASSGQVGEVGQKLKEKIRDAVSNAKRDEVFLDYAQGTSTAEKMLIGVERKTEEVGCVICDREKLLAVATQLRAFEAKCRKFKGDFWYWLEVENSTDQSDTLMGARLHQDTFLRHQKEHVALHRSLLSEGEQLAGDLEPYKSVVTVSASDRTPGSTHTWFLVTDLRRFLASSQPATEQLREKLGRALEFETMKKDGKEVIGEVSVIMEDLLAVPGIGDSLEGVQKLQGRVEGIDGQLQATRISVDMFKSRAEEVASVQTNLSARIDEIVASVEAGYQEVSGCVSARRAMLDSALDHFQTHTKFLAACGECQALFSINTKATPETIPSCEEEQRRDAGKKDQLTVLASTFEASSVALLGKMGEWCQLIQGHRTKVEESVDSVPPLPADVIGSQTSVFSNEPTGLGSQSLAGIPSWDGVKRHSTSDLVSSRTQEEAGLGGGGGESRHSWEAVNRRAAFAKKGRSSSTSHSYSASRRYSSPQPFAAKKRAPTPPLLSPAGQTSRKNSAAPNSDPMSRKGLTSPVTLEGGEGLKRHASEEDVPPKPPVTKAVSNPASTTMLAATSASSVRSYQYSSSSKYRHRSSPSSHSSDYQLNKSVYRGYVSWDETDRQMVLRMVEAVKLRTGELLIKWQQKAAFLDSTHTWLEFRCLADEILHWHDKDCVEFMTDSSYGDSIDDVEGLIGRHQEFVEGQMPTYFSRVQRLISWSQSLSQSDALYLQRIQSLAVDVSSKWRRAVDVATTRKGYLQEALTFHVSYFEANNWCSTTHNFLEEMERKLSVCEESSDAREQNCELEGYMMFTKADQLKREDQMTSIASQLESKHLKELSRQVQTSAKDYIVHSEQLKEELQKREQRLLKIEKEADDKSRAAKQRDRVVEELLETERSYCSILAAAASTYMRALLEGPEEVPEHLKRRTGTIFGNLATVEAYHREEFLPNLELCDNNCDKIADLILTEIDKMTSIYVNYCGGKSKSESVIIENRAFFDQLKMSLAANESLSSYLIRPVQRITKYPLMMKDAIRYTQQAGQDASRLLECSRALKTIPKKTNDAVHLSALEDFEEPFLELGELQYQGMLFMSEPRALRSTEKERQVFLFDRAILICRKDVLENAKVQYSFKQKIDFLSTSVKLQEVERSEQADSFKFGLLLRSEQKLAFRTTNHAQGKEWMEQIGSVLRSHKLSGGAKYGTMNSPPSGREGRRRGAVGTSVDGDDSIFTSRSRSQTLPRFRTVAQHTNRYIVTEDHNTVDGGGGLSVTKGDRIEIVDFETENLWMGRTLDLSTTLKQGWISPKVLMPLIDTATEGVPLGVLAMLSKTSPLLHRANQNPAPAPNPQQAPRPGSAHGMRQYSTTSTLAQPSGPSLPVTVVTRSKSISPPPTSVASEQPVSRTVEANATYSRPKQSRPGISGLFRRNGSLRGSKSKKKAKKSRARLHPQGQEDEDSESGSVTPVNSQSPRGSGIFDDDLDVLAIEQDRVMSEGLDSQSVNSLQLGTSLHSANSKHSLNYDSVSVDSDNYLPPPAQFGSYGNKQPLSARNSTSSLGRGVVQYSEGLANLSQTSHEDELLVADNPGQTKISMLIRRLKETESAYTKDLLDLIKGYTKYFQGSDVPDAIREKKKLVFSNIKALHSLHDGNFIQLLQESGESHEEIATSFLELMDELEAYTTYCENAPRAAAQVWGPVKLYVEKCQRDLQLPKSLSEYLAMPMQRLVQYEYYLEEMLKTAEQYSLERTHLKRAHGCVRQLREKGGDTCQLSLIAGYEGSIYSSGAVLRQEDLFLSEGLGGEGGRWVCRVFLLEQKVIFTRSISGTRLFEYFDSLPLSESLLVDSPQGDPLQFTVADFRSGEIEAHYCLEALTPAGRDEWVGSIRDALAKQLQILHSVRANGGTEEPAAGEMFGMSPSFMRDREKRRKVSSQQPAQDSDSSSISEDWDGRERIAYGRGSLRRSKRSTHDRPPLTISSFATASTYIVKSNWSFEDDFEVIPEERMSPKPVRKGQVFEVFNQDAFWWKARLVKDISPPASYAVGQDVWIPSSRMEKKKKAPPAPPRRVDSLVNRSPALPPHSRHHASTLSPDVRERSGSFNASLDGVSIASSTARTEERLSSPNSSSSLNSEGQRSASQTNILTDSKAFPAFTVPVSTLNVPLARSVKLKCTLDRDQPGVTIRWFHNGQPLAEGSNTAPMKFGPVCTLDLVTARRQDVGSYLCMASREGHTATAIVEVSVTCPPGQPLNATVEYVTVELVALSWTPPTDDGGAPITKFMVLALTENDHLLATKECGAAELSCVMDKLDPTVVYQFRVRACNDLGPGDPSPATQPVSLPRPPQPKLKEELFGDYYEVIKVIARGRFSVVQECKSKKTGTTYAVKKYLKASLLQDLTGEAPGRDVKEAEQTVAKRVERELSILLGASHPCFPAAYEGFAGSTAFTIVSEYIDGRPLLDYLIDKDALQESLVVDSCRQLLDGLAYLHTGDTAHLDVLPENVLAVDQGVVPRLKLVGFGSACRVGEGWPSCILDSNRVNIEFSAPEIVEGLPVSTSSDLWSIGVLIYVILTGLSPFAGSNKAMTTSNIKNVKFSMPQQYFSDVSPEAKDFIKRLLVRQESDRLTSSQCLQHPWIKLPEPSPAQRNAAARRWSSCVKLDTSRLKVFNASRAWKASLHSKKRRSLVGVQQKS